MIENIESTLREAILRGERDLRGGGSNPTNGMLAKQAGMSEGTYSGLRSQDRSMPRAVSYARNIAQALRLPVGSMFEDMRGAEYLAGNDDIAVRLARTANTPREQALRLAALGLVLGEPRGQIEGRIRRLRASRQMPEEMLDEARLCAMASGGMGFGFVEILATEDAEELQDFELAQALSEALARVAPGPRRPIVRVVRNLPHREFRRDPIAPYLVSLVAHRILAWFLQTVPSIYRIGLAGGMHCDTFVRSISGVSTPFPDPSGDKQLTFVPLTLEPFRSHRLPISDAVVGQMAGVASSLLGPTRVEARTFQSFGYVTDNRVEDLDTDAIAMVRDEYQRLDVAIYGCGDRYANGWLNHILRGVRAARGAEPVTDVCLNLLSEDAQPIPLQGNREFIGVGLGDIRRLVNDDHKLAMLLTSGATKGQPISVVGRAGLAGAIICDQQAARAAIHSLEGA